MAPREEKGQKAKTKQQRGVQRFNKRALSLYYDELTIE